jgi:hypothetical protein
MYLHVPERAPLLTARLTLEPLAGGHAAHLWGPLQDPALYEWIGSSPPPDVETLRARWSQLGAVAGGTSLGWAARRSSDSAWIGKLDATIDHAGVATNVGREGRRRLALRAVIAPRCRATDAACPS